jgi:hypothetical protein
MQRTIVFLISGFFKTDNFICPLLPFYLAFSTSKLVICSCGQAYPKISLKESNTPSKLQTTGSLCGIQYIEQTHNYKYQIQGNRFYTR